MLYWYILGNFMCVWVLWVWLEFVEWVYGKIINYYCLGLEFLVNIGIYKKILIEIYL